MTPSPRVEWEGPGDGMERSGENWLMLLQPGVHVIISRDVVLMSCVPISSLGQGASSICQPWKRAICHSTSISTQVNSTPASSWPCVHIPAVWGPWLLEHLAVSSAARSPEAQGGPVSSPQPRTQRHSCAEWWQFRLSWRKSWYILKMAKRTQKRREWVVRRKCEK
jgi:hypothetical protein